MNAKLDASPAYAGRLKIARRFNGGKARTRTTQSPQGTADCRITNLIRKQSASSGNKMNAELDASPAYAGRLKIARRFNGGKARTKTTQSPQGTADCRITNLIRKQNASSGNKMNAKLDAS